MFLLSGQWYFNFKTRKPNNNIINGEAFEKWKMYLTEKKTTQSDFVVAFTISHR